MNHGYTLYLNPDTIHSYFSPTRYRRLCKTVTGIYCIEATDFILASLPAALKLERSYYSTENNDSVLGRGWKFPCASRIYRDTKDTDGRETRYVYDNVHNRILIREKSNTILLYIHFRVYVKDGSRIIAEEPNQEEQFLVKLCGCKQH